MGRKNKSLYDIAVEKKKNGNDERIVIQEKVSNLKILVSVLCKIIKLVVLFIVGIILTIGITVVINESLRTQFLEALKLSVGLN